MFNSFNEMMEEIFKKDKKIADLEAKLAEKEKELSYMTKQAKKFNNEAQKYYEDAYCNDFQNQKAIAELEKVKEIFGRIRWYKGSCNFGEVKYFDDKLVSWTDVEKEIDNQIKSLKGEE